MIGSDKVIEYSQAKAFFGLKEAGKSAPYVLCEFQLKLLFVATVGNVPHLPWNMMSIRSCQATCR